MDNRAAFLLAGLVLTLPVTACAESYLGEFNCRVVNPLPREHERITWTGACLDGFAEGPGVLQWYQKEKPQLRFEGSLRRGIEDGPGTLFKTPQVKADLTQAECAPVKEIVVKGTFIAGVLVSPVEWTDRCGSVYRGSWRDHRPNGVGTIHYFDAVDYEGDFVNGLRDGLGSATYPNGDRYEGHWRSGSFDGAGVLQHAGGSSYQGNFKGGRFDGVGAIIGANGERVEGSFKYGELQMNSALAISKWTPLALSGDPFGQTGLAISMLANSTTAADDRMALHWLALAVKQRHFPARKRLAVLYAERRDLDAGETFAQYWSRHLIADFHTTNVPTPAPVEALLPVDITRQVTPPASGWIPTVEKKEYSDKSCYPNYPSEAMSKRSQGDTTVRLLIDSDDVVRDASILKTSGSIWLDAESLNSRLGCKFKRPKDTKGDDPKWISITYVWKVD